MSIVYCLVMIVYFFGKKFKWGEGKSIEEYYKCEWTTKINALGKKIAIQSHSISSKHRLSTPYSDFTVAWAVAAKREPYVNCWFWKIEKK